MPERPDLAYVIPRLRDSVVGRRIAQVRVKEPIVLRVGAQGTLETLLVGRTITAVRRHLHFIVFDLEPGDVTLAVHPMLAGRFRLDDAGRRDLKSLCVALGFSEGPELRYRDDKRMGKVYLMATEAMHSVPGFMPVGVDVLNPKAFTVEVLAAILKKRRDQLKVFLLDKGAVDSFGNAYADEALHRAGMHPKRRCRELDAGEVQRLHAGMVQTLAEATQIVAERAPALDEKVRDFLRVRNRKGQPCPVCKSTIRAAGVRGHDAFFCPTCQPDPKDRGFVSWRSGHQN
ncbi:MAG: Fpg/Nei family DNA glycosylase [Myxococcota bacterium]